MTSFRTVPTYNQALMQGGKLVQAWYRWFQGIDTGLPPSPEEPVQVGGSPFAFVAPAQGFVILTGGSVSSVQYSRAAVHNTGQTSGMFPLSNGDTLTVTYASLPAMLWVPQ